MSATIGRIDLTTRHDAPATTSTRPAKAVHGLGFRTAPCGLSDELSDIFRHRDWNRIGDGLTPPLVAHPWQGHTLIKALDFAHTLKGKVTVRDYRIGFHFAPLSDHGREPNAVPMAPLKDTQPPVGTDPGIVDIEALDLIAFDLNVRDADNILYQKPFRLGFADDPPALIQHFQPVVASRARPVETGKALAWRACYDPVKAFGYDMKVSDIAARYRVRPARDTIARSFEPLP